MEQSTASAPQAPAPSASSVAYAGFWARIAAFVIDYIISAIFFFVLGLVFSLISIGTSSTSIEGLFFMNGFTLIIWWVYHVLMTYYFQATVGKMAVNLIVMNAAQERPTLGKIILRETIGKLIAALILSIGFLMVAFTKKKQGLHDLMADTYVVHKDPARKRKAVIIAVNSIGFFVVIAVLGIFASIALVSFGGAQEKARSAAFSVAVSSVLPATIICADDREVIQPPKNNGVICPSEGTWPDLSELDGQWGGCPHDLTFDFAIGDESLQFGDETLQYCATDQSGRVFKCTIDGCAWEVSQ